MKTVHNRTKRTRTARDAGRKSERGQAQNSRGRNVRPNLIEAETPDDLREASGRWDETLTRRTMLITGAWTAVGTLMGVMLGILGRALWWADPTIGRVAVGALLGGMSGSLIAFTISSAVTVRQMRKEGEQPGDQEQSTDQSKEGW